MEHKKIFTDIYENYGFGSLESRSGPGSTLEETEHLREDIKKLVKQKGIKSVVDIPCGDFTWMKEIVNVFDSYFGGDIVDECVQENTMNYGNRRITFSTFDLINDKIPTADLLIVRDVIGHQPISDGKKIVENILKSDCKFLLSTTWAKKTSSGWDKCEDGVVHRQNEGVSYGQFYPVNLMSEPFDFPIADEFLEEITYVDGYENGIRKVLAFWDLSKVREHIKKVNSTPKSNRKKITLVTGLWDIGRGELGGGWSRSMNDYLSYFEQLLKVEYNLIIFGDKKLGEFVKERRSDHNTQFIERKLSWFENNEFFDKIQKIRNTPSWYKQSGWLMDSTQAKLEYYNPLVMSKMFLLHDSKILDKFKSEYLFWIDAGISKTVNVGYFTHDKVLEVLPDKISDFLFVCFPYDGKVEIHGFEYKKMCQYAGSEVDMVARGGFFGGTKEAISLVNTVYYSTLLDTLDNGYMGTEESVFTILTYRNPNIIQYAKIENDGLLFKFFEDLKSGDVKLYSKNNNSKPISITKTSNVALYVIGFNSPKQFQTLIDSMLEYDPNFIDKPKKYLLDNSTDLKTTPTYIEICEKYGFNHIKKDNIGICGGRQWIAEHADENGFDGYWFSEDDMFFQKKPGDVCKNGFNRYVDNFYNKCLDIVKKEGFDFLKINFTEFFGDNSTQWSWYNVPQDFREKNWPEKSRLPVSGLDPDAPKTVFKNIKSLNGLPYATGEIYYSNWTQFVTKEGNQKMFLDTKWAHPFENTWMSHMYQETIKGNLKPGILLMTPIEHNRFDHYDRSIRREN